MKVRLLTDDVVSLEAITPERVTITIVDGDARTELALDHNNIMRLWEFMVLLMRWRARLPMGQGPPEGFDRDITDGVAQSSPEGA